MVRTGLRDKFLAEAVECAAYIRNPTRTFATKGNKSPLDSWSGKKPDILHLNVFRCMAYTHVPDAQKKKLDKKAMKLQFGGYSVQSKCSRLLEVE